jgi:hypothetical protein
VSAALLPESVGGYLSEPAASDDRLDRTPVLITHGTLDDIVPRQDVDASAVNLRAGGASALLAHMRRRYFDHPEDYTFRLLAAHDTQRSRRTLLAGPLRQERRWADIFALALPADHVEEHGWRLLGYKCFAQGD